jgi:hypothetical protein
MKSVSGSALRQMVRVRGGSGVGVAEGVALRGGLLLAYERKGVAEVAAIGGVWVGTGDGAGVSPVPQASIREATLASCTIRLKIIERISCPSTSSLIVHLIAREVNEAASFGQAEIASLHPRCQL